MFSKSIFSKQLFKSMTMRNFREGVMVLNSNKKSAVPKSRQVLELEKLRHQQNIKASEKRGLPKFDMENAKKLLSGKYHEIEDDDEQLTASMNKQSLSEDVMQR